MALLLTYSFLIVDSDNDVVLHQMPPPISATNEFTTPYRAGAIMNGGKAYRLIHSNEFRCDLSMSPFPQENPSQKSLEFTLDPSSTGRLFLRNIAGTPQSIFSHFKAERTQFTPSTPVTPIRRTITQVERSSVMTPSSLSDEPPSSIPLDFKSPSWTKNDVELEIRTPLISKRPLEDLESSPIRTPKRPKLNYAYFGRKALRAVDVMFPPRDEMTDEDEDMIIDTPPRTGERIYVQQLMRNLFLNPDKIEFPHRNTTRTVWKLHPYKLIKKHEQHTALVFDTNPISGECNIFQGVVDVLGIPEKKTHRQRRENKDGIVRFSCDEMINNPFESAGDWDFLKKWNYMKDDTLLPVFLESDEEDALYDDATIREMEEEERNKKKNGGAQQPITKALSRGSGMP